METPALVHPFLSIRGAPGPALQEGLSLAATAEAELPARGDAGAGRDTLADLSGDASDLRAQRWGLVVSDDARGTRLASLLAPLSERRGQQQGAPPHVYRVAPGMSAAQATAWVNGPYRDEVSRDATRLPRYLLLLGDADGVSWELQQALSRHGAFPGRLAFDADGDYQAYVEKVLAWEHASVPARKALFYAVRDGSAAVSSGMTGLLAPSRASLEAAFGRGPGGITSIGEAAEQLSPAALESEAGQMLSYAAATPGSLFLSLSHGVGLPAGEAFAKRRAVQGALQLHGERALGPADVTSAPFFEGGAWFFFACFSAGTPASSAYGTWLSGLSKMGRWGSPIAEVLGALPAPPAPFVAALPKAALASPRGPLAVIGHVDLAWSWSYLAGSLATGKTTYLDRHERFDVVFHALLRRRRFGAALHELASAGAAVGQTLLTMYGNDAIAPDEDPKRAAQRAYLWLEHHDLGAYVLLGDPAAQLPGALTEAAPEPPANGVGARPVAEAAGPARAAAPPDKALLLAEEDVLACLSGQDIDKQAASGGRSPEELARMVTAYQEAGRRALAQVLTASGEESGG